MQPINNLNNPDQLNELLKQAFLDLDMSKAEDSKLMDEVAAQVMDKEWPLETEKSNKGKGKSVSSAGKGWIWILSGLAVVAGITATVLLLNKEGNENQHTYLIKSETKAEENKSTSDKITSHSEMEKVNVDSNTDVEKNLEQVLVQKENEAKSIVPTKKQNEPGSYNDGRIYTSNNSVIENNLVSFASANNINASAATTVPLVNPTTAEQKDSIEKLPDTKEQKTPVSILSAEELEKHKKDKKKMEDDFAGLRFADYSKINVDIKKSTIEIGFFMKRAEVTIKEYKLFLTDLLANGKTREYEIAKPKLDNIWKDPKDKSNRVFLEMYFKKSKFENYPVVCISPEGMELYCSWLKEEIESYYKRNNEKIKLTVCLPDIKQWSYVASEGNTSHKFGTSNGKLKNTNWSHLVFINRNWTANFIETQGKFVAKGDSVMVEEKPKKKDGPQAKRKVTREAFTSMAYTYPSVNFDLYNLSGNVSEIVSYTDDSGNKKYRSIGGNWNSTKEYLKIDAPDEFNGNTKPSPYIGFRPVIIME